jgi:hypothetical protein
MELLVVVAIIAILAGMFQQALGKARELFAALLGIQWGHLFNVEPPAAPSALHGSRGRSPSQCALMDSGACKLTSPSRCVRQARIAGRGGER